MIQPIPPPTDPKGSSPAQPKSKPVPDSLLDREGEFDKAMESIAMQLAKDFWSEQDIKK